MIAGARRFYEKPEVERPGLLSVELGMALTRNMRIHTQNDYDGPKPFLDDEYRHELIMDMDEFLSPQGRVNQFFDRISFAFDVSTPEGQ
jgi:hypothetical protein